jgi:hypothetical protein
MKPAQATTRHRREVAPSAALILLAGGLRPSPLQQMLGIPPLCLPLGPHDTLLDRWLSAAESLSGCGCVAIAVSTSEDADSIRAALAKSRFAESDAMQIRVVMEPETWRGPAGLLHDLVQSGRCDLEVRPDTAVLAGEASCLPPENLENIIDRLGVGTPGVSVIGRTGEPAGLYAFTGAALGLIPPVGFYDIKEQMLPELYARGTPVQELRIARESHRIRDRETYLRAVRHALPTDSEITGCSPEARIVDSARVAGSCLIGPGALIGPHAIVHESIVLGDAVIGRGAVVSHSVVGPSCRVKPGETVKRAVVGPSGGNGGRSATMRALSEILGLGAIWRGAGAS